MTAGQASLFDGPVVPPVRTGFAGPNPPTHRNTDPATSTAAAAVATHGRASNRDRYFALIQASGAHGMTRDEIADAVDARGAEDRALSRRLTDLHQQGRTYDSGRTRTSHSGLQQIVWVAVPERATR